MRHLAGVSREALGQGELRMPRGHVEGEAGLQQADASSSSEQKVDSGALGCTHKHIRCVRIPAADQRDQAASLPIVDFHVIGRNCLPEYVIAHRKVMATLG